MRKEMLSTERSNPSRQGLRSVTVASLMVVTGGAIAAPIDVGNSDVELRWDNTIKYSAGVRLKNPSDLLTQATAPGAGVSANTLNGDDGDRNFKRGGLISNRVDLFSELDLIYRKDFGLRVSGAAWYDDVYNKTNDNNSPATDNNLSAPYDKFTDGTRNVEGRKAEVLDAFLFGAADVGDARLSGRLGRHSVLWGESLFYGANAIAGTQSPVDAIKAASVPGSTTKEIIMPVGQLSSQLQLSPALTFMGYYQFEWEATRLPAAGSYFSVADFLGDGGERIRFAPGVPGIGLGRLPDMRAKDNGQFGLGLRTQLDNVDIGVYADRFHAKTPVIYSRATAPTGTPGTGFGNYQEVFPEDIWAFGASASTTVDGVNYAAELSVRHKTPLVSDPQAVTGLVADNNDHPYYAIGDTAHANFSMIWALPRMFLSDEPTLSMEFAYNQLLKCTRNCTAAAPGLFRDKGALDPGTDRRAAAVRATFAAPHRNVLDGLDLTPSLSMSFDHGRSPVVPLGANNGGDATLALAANYLAVWDFSLAYTHFYGKANTAVYQSTTPTLNGNYTFDQSDADRDFVSVSVKYAF